MSSGNGYSFDSAAHLYTMGRAKVPSTTQVLKLTGLSRDLSMVRPDVLANKRAIGNITHKCTRLYNQRKLDLATIDPAVMPYFQGYLQFIQDTGFVPQRVEEARVAKLGQLLYGMRPDVSGLIRGEPWIIDYKLIEGPPDYGWAIQLAAYEHGAPPPLIPPFRFRRMTLQLFGNGRYRTKEWTDPGDLDEYAWGLALVWRRINRGEKVWEGR
jgi:hypothetical protein